jgi:hypothetical protein
MTIFKEQPPSSRDGENNNSKYDIDLVESAAFTGNGPDFSIAQSRLSKLHRDYLMERHGTLELDPLPTMDPADPYNWPEWKVST